jgi:hypothetical protein
MKKNFLWAIAISFGVASCIAEKGDPQQPAAGLTRLHETFEALSDENSITRLSGWTNIMVVDSTYTAPLQWLAYETGCNMAARASAHMFDNSNSGIRYETWLLTPPLDFDKAVNKTLSFRVQATHWQHTTTLDAFLVPDLSAVKSKPQKLVQLKANLPTLSSANRWLKTTLTMGGAQGVAMLGFRYRAVGGSAASTSFLVDDVMFGDVGALPDVCIFEESFEESLGQFTPVSKSGEQKWEWNGNAASAPYVNAAKISGYTSGASTPNEDWLISPPIDLSNVQSATLTFDQNINKGTPSAAVMRQEQRVLASTTCTDGGKPDDAAWVPLAVTRYPSGSSWDFACSGKISLTPYAGSSNVRIAFTYTCGDSNAATWSLANVKVAK